jgi:hypothetical protein
MKIYLLPPALIIFIGLGLATLTGCSGSATGNGASSGTTLPVTVNAPTVSSVAPSALAYATAATLTVTGSGFTSSSVVHIGSNVEQTTFVSATQLTATVPAGQLASGVPLTVVVSNGSTSSGSAVAVNVEVDNPVPSITSLNPSAVASGATGPTTISVTGIGFSSTSVVRLGGSPRVTTVLSPTQLSFVLTVADQATAQDVAITVANPAPGGGVTSNAIFAILSGVPSPVLESVSPTLFYSGSQNVRLTATGNNFTGQSVIQWNGTSIPTAFTGNPTALYGTVPAAFLASNGPAIITVFTSTAVVGLSSSITVSVAPPPVPVITSVSPVSIPIATDASLSVSGTGFSSTSSVQWNGVPVPTVYANPVFLTGSVPASQVNSLGDNQVTVITPGPGGGVSASFKVTVTPASMVASPVP